MIINKAKQRCISNPNKVINEGANLIVGFLAKSTNLTLNEKKIGRTKNRDRVAKKTDDNSTSFREWQRPISLSIRSIRWSFGFTGWCFSCKATVRLPLLPGGATILCHFWNKVVFKQSRGDNAYALCLDISSCMGSRITHNCNRIAICTQLNHNEKSLSLTLRENVDKIILYFEAKLSIVCVCSRAQIIY